VVEAENKKPSPPQNGNEGIHNPFGTSRTVWPHPSLGGEVPLRGADEHNQAGILTSGFKPHSRLPSLAASGLGSL